ncbi:MAG: phosphoribosyltransferase family protein [Candidatus Moraniibacteriota bacterium]
MKNIFWDLLFPSYCIICEKPGKHLCQECFHFIPINLTNFCPICQKIETFAGRVCNVCENENKKIYLDGVIIASYYKNPVLREAIYHFKYSFIQKLAWPLAKILLNKLFLLETFPFEEFVFTAVPLHRKRHKWRGFNQAELLGKNLQKILSKNNIEINLLLGLLVRQKYIKPQMKIHSTAERKKNIIGCFSFNRAVIKKLPEKIIIIDDVITTGATLEECAKLLKRSGAKKVWGLVLARQGH